MDLTLSETADFLKNRDHYLILTHTRPDGDTLGSAAALCSALQRLGKQAHLYWNPGVTRKYFPFVGDYMGEDSYQTVVSVDVAGENLFPDGFKGQVDLAIDHHPSNSRFAGLTLLDSEKASCGEIILALIGILLGGPTQEEADLLYIAVSTDTGCFRYANTSGDTFRAAAALLDAGANASGLTKLFFRTCSPARLTLEGLIFSSMRVIDGGVINIAFITNEMLRQSGATEDDMDDIAALAGRTEGNEVAVTVRETKDGNSKISMRSGEKVNVSAICARFGGGGHAMAAGCTMDCPPEEAADQLLPILQEALRS